MPLEISETFSMAPLTGRWRDPEFVIPRDFDIGEGHVRDMQQMLISEFEDLGNEYNVYSLLEGKAARFGMDIFKSSLDESKSRLRAIRDKAVQLMKDIYSEGHVPLTPDKTFDRDIATILKEPLMSSAALPNNATAAAECSTSNEVSSVTQTVEATNGDAVFINCSEDRLTWMPAASCEQKVKQTMSPASSNRNQPLRFVSRGAAARKRAEAAWYARHMARKRERERILSETSGTSSWNNDIAETSSDASTRYDATQRDEAALGESAEDVPCCADITDIVVSKTFPKVPDKC